jgi:hypothetical protein
VDGLGQQVLDRMGLAAAISSVTLARFMTKASNLKMFALKLSMALI